MCLGAHSEKTPVRLVKRLIVFHWMPQNDWYPLVLVLTSMWKSCGKKCLAGGLATRLGPLINRLAHQQQWQFLLACGVAGHCLHGNQAAFASVSQEAPKQCGLSRPPLSLPICGHQFVHQMWCSPTKKPAVGQAR